MQTNVTDKPLAQDDGKNSLGMNDYATALKNFIIGADTPFTIAIQGEWGCGKTTLMQMVCHELCGEAAPDKAFIKNEGKNFCGVRLDSWECALMRSPNDVYLQVISSIAEAIDSFATESSQENSHDSETKNSQEETSGNPKKALGNLTAFVTNRIAPLLTVVPNFGVQLTGAVLTAVGKDIANALSEGGEANVPSRENGSRKGEADAPNRKREVNAPNKGNMTDAPSIKNAHTIKEFRKELEKAVQKIQKTEIVENAYKGILFFIDDLDRIDPEVAVQILEILKNLFEVEGCIFVLAIDYDVVVKGLKKKFGDYDIKKDYEFRRFFDKIIQLPFSMPVSGYKIGEFLDSMLKKVGYYAENGLKPNELERLQEMAKLSTANNPRSIKRLVNSLSLIKTIMDVKKPSLAEEQKQLCFGVVCVQIAYPRIYDMLVAQPNFVKDWDEDFARSQGLSLPDKAPEDMANPADWDKWETWRRIAYMAAQDVPWMKARFFDIDNLLRLLPACVPEKENFGKMMGEVLAFAAATGTSTVRTQGISLSRQEFLVHVKDDSQLKKLFVMLDDDFIKKSPPLLSETYTSSTGMLQLVHPRSSSGDMLLRILIQNDEVALKIPSSSDGVFSDFKKLEENDVSPLFEKLVEVYNELADDNHKL